MSALRNPYEYVRRNTDARIVVSTIVGSFVLGGVVYLAMRSGIKPLASIASIAK